MILLRLGALVASVTATLAFADPSPKDAYIAKMLGESPPADDARIVPGWRIGKIYLGMSAQTLLAAMGAPSSSTSMGVEGGSQYVWNTPRGCLQADEYKGRVARVRTCGESGEFRLDGGGHVGDGDLAVKAQVGAPAASRAFQGDGRVAYCYDDGLWIVLRPTTEKIEQIVVQKRKDLWPCKT